MLIFDLDNFSADRVNEVLTNSVNLYFLTDSNIFKNDIEFTQDFTG